MLVLASVTEGVVPVVTTGGYRAAHVNWSQDEDGWNGFYAYADLDPQVHPTREACADAISRWRRAA